MGEYSIIKIYDIIKLISIFYKIHIYSDTDKAKYLKVLKRIRIKSLKINYGILDKEYGFTRVQ